MLPLESNSRQVPVSLPLYAQTREAISACILDGEWPVGQCLPNESRLAERFGVSIGTIRRAMESLVEAGMIVRRQGRGTFVLSTRPVALEDRNGAFLSDNGQQLSLSREVIRVSHRPCSAGEAGLLGLSGRPSAIEIRQLLMGLNGMRGLETILLPAREFRDVEVEVGNGDELETICARRGLSIAPGIERVSAKAADDEIAKLLDLSKGNPLLVIERTLKAPDQRAIGYYVGTYALGQHCHWQTAKPRSV